MQRKLSVPSERRNCWDRLIDAFFDDIGSKHAAPLANPHGPIAFTEFVHTLRHLIKTSVELHHAGLLPVSRPRPPRTP